MSKIKRESKFFDRSTFDDPENDYVEAGSNEEADMLADWDSAELVDTIQAQDRQYHKLQLELIATRKDRFKFRKALKEISMQPTNEDNTLHCVVTASEALLETK